VTAGSVIEVPVIITSGEFFSLSFPIGWLRGTPSLVVGDETIGAAVFNPPESGRQLLYWTAPLNWQQPHPAGELVTLYACR
jgi:hypothetical protein